MPCSGLKENSEPAGKVGRGSRCSAGALLGSPLSSSLQHVHRPAFCFSSRASSQSEAPAPGCQAQLPKGASGDVRRQLRQRRAPPGDLCVSVVSLCWGASPAVQVLLGGLKSPLPHGPSSPSAPVPPPGKARLDFGQQPAKSLWLCLGLGSLCRRPTERVANPPLLANIAVPTAPHQWGSSPINSPLIHHEEERATNIIPDE